VALATGIVAMSTVTCAAPQLCQIQNFNPYGTIGMGLFYFEVYSSLLKPVSAAHSSGSPDHEAKMGFHIVAATISPSAAKLGDHVAWSIELERRYDVKGKRKPKRPRKKITDIRTECTPPPQRLRCSQVHEEGTPR